MRRYPLFAPLLVALPLSVQSPAWAASAVPATQQGAVGSTAKTTSTVRAGAISPAAGRATHPTPASGATTPGRARALPAPVGPSTVTAIPTAPLTGFRRSTDAPSADWESVHLTTQDDLRLAANFFPPRGMREARAPGAILVHDAGGQRVDLSALAMTLQRRGFAVLTLDLRGHGDSRTEAISFDAQDPAAAERLWAFTLRDIEAAARYLRSRDEVHASNLSLIGVGAGAALAARHAVRDGNARAVVLIAPQQTSLGFNLLADVKDLGGLPTLILAERDGRSNAERLAEAGNSAENLRYIEVTVLRSNGARVLEDARLPREVARHLREHVASKR